MLKRRDMMVIPALLALAASAAFAARAPLPSVDIKQKPDEQKLIDILKSSESQPADKAITCKQLAIYGSKAAVPALAALLPDKELASWARIALEVIPGPEADEALRNAMAKTQGRLLIGIINSIGVRRDAASVPALKQKLEDPDADVACAAAAAMGHIGGAQSAQILEQSLAISVPAVRDTVAEGCSICAAQFLDAGNLEAAMKLYDAVRKTNVPKQRLIEATRGAILSRQTAGIPLLVEQLRSPDKAMFGVGLRTARELAGEAVTDALLAELAKAPPERQGLLMLALSDRGDAKALPAVLDLAKNGQPRVRLVAISVLEHLGNASCLPVLLEAASGDDAELAQAARTTLARLGGKEIDAEIFSRLQQSSGKARQVLIELAEQRRLEGALPIFLACAEDADTGVRTAALVAIGSIGEEANIADVVKLLVKTQDAARQSEIEKSLMAISSRYGASCVATILPLSKSNDSATRKVALNALACCGGPAALAAVTAAVDDPDPALQDEAVRTLSTWANRWPEDGAVTAPLLALAKSGKKTSHQVLAVRGYLQYVQGSKQLRPPQKLAKVNEILPLLNRPEEKRLAISALSAIGGGGAMQRLIAFTDDPAIADDACSSIVNLATKNAPGLNKDVRKKALEAVVAKSKSDATRRKAEALLKANG